MTTALANQITLAERSLAGAPDLDAGVRLYFAAESAPTLRELFAHLRPSGARARRHAGRIDPTYQPA